MTSVCTASSFWPCGEVQHWGAGTWPGVGLPQAACALAVEGLGLGLERQLVWGSLGAMGSWGAPLAQGRGWTQE